MVTDQYYYSILEVQITRKTKYIIIDYHGFLRELIFSHNSNENGRVPQGSALLGTLFFLTSAFRSSPTLSIYNMAGEPLPIFRRIDLYVKFVARLATCDGGKHSNINNEIIKLITENVCISVRIIPREFNMSLLWDNNYYEINTEYSPRDI